MLIVFRGERMLLTSEEGRFTERNIDFFSKIFKAGNNKKGKLQERSVSGRPACVKTLLQSASPEADEAQPALFLDFFLALY